MREGDIILLHQDGYVLLLQYDFTLTNGDIRAVVGSVIEASEEDYDYFRPVNLVVVTPFRSPVTVHNEDAKLYKQYMQHKLV